MTTAQIDYQYYEEDQGIGQANAFSNLIHYYDSQFVQQRYQEPSKTNLTVLNSPVGAWIDRKGGIDLTRLTNNPIEKLTDGVEFNGINNYLTATITALPSTGFTIYYRVFPDDFDVTQIHFNWGNMTIYSTTGSKIQMAHSGVGLIGTSLGNLTVSSKNTIGIRYTPSSGAYRILINSLAETTGSQARTVSGTSFYVGMEAGTSFPLDGKIRSLAIHNLAHSDSVMNSAMTYWNNAN